MILNRSLVKLVLVSGLAFLPLLAQAATCRVSIPDADSAIMAPKYIGKDYWYGDNDLAALIPGDGVWVGDGPEKDFRKKFWWWHQGYDAQVQPRPEIEVSAVKLSGERITVPASKAVGKSDARWNAMFVLMRFPEPGCWKVTGNYRNTSLSFIVKVGED